MSYGIHEIRLEDALHLRSTEWKECNSHFPDHSLHSDPEWIAEHFRHSGSTISDLDQLDFAEPWARPEPGARKTSTSTSWRKIAKW